MCDVIRLAKGLSSEEFDLRRPFSIFRFLENRFHGDSLHSLHRIFSQLRRSKATRMVMEELPLAAEIAHEVADLQSRCTNYEDLGAVRLSFFQESEFAGYAIVRAERVDGGYRSHVFESVVPKYSHKHNFVPGQATFSVRCGDETHAIDGVMYCQQNNLNKACAQVALRSLLASVFPEKAICYSELNQIACVSELGRGLGSEQIRAIVRHYKIPFVDLDYENSKPGITPYHRFIYAGMESGLGGLVGFECTNDRHIIPFFGHTFNQDTWSPYASKAYFSVGSNTQYIPSDEWLSSFIGHDDNFGSNYCIPKKFISSDKVKYVLNLLPAKVVGSPLVAEARAVDFLYRNIAEINPQSEWGKRWLRHVENRQDTVARPVLIHRDKYEAHLRSVRDWKGNQENSPMLDVIQQLPECLWMVELSLPDLFSANYSKIGELLFTLVPSTDDTGDQIDLAILRIPGEFLLRLPSSTGLFSVESTLQSHVPLYTRDPAALAFDNDHPVPPGLA